MVADRYSPVITVDLTAGDRSQVGAVSCVRVSEVRRHRRVQENARVRIGRHIIIVLDQGSGRHVVDTETYELEPESVIYIEPGRLHQWLPDEDFEGWVIAIDQHVCPPDLFKHPGMSSPLVSLGTAIDIAHSLVASLTAPELLPEGARLRIQLSLAAALLELISGATSRAILSAGAVTEHKIVATFRGELEFNFATTRSVSDYAELVGCSTKTLTRATNRVLGQTPKEVIDSRVAYAACRLLSNTDISVSWIAHKLGFSEQSNFSKFFSRTVQMTPAEYRSSSRRQSAASVS